MLSMRAIQDTDFAHRLRRLFQGRQLKLLELAMEASAQADNWNKSDGADNT